MEEWQDEILVCSNCGEGIDPELHKYFQYGDITLCENCLDEATHY